MHVTFVTKPGPLGKDYCTRPDFDENWTQAELDALVSSACAVPPAKCAEIGGEYFRQIRQSPTMRRMFKLFSQVDIKPTTGGTATTPDGFHTAEDLNADFSINFTSEVIDAWRATCTIEKTGG